MAEESLWPNSNQERELSIMLESHQRLYKACLEQRSTAYKNEKKNVKYTDQSAWFKLERKTNPFFARLNFSSAQFTMRRLDKAFAAFFRRTRAGQKPGYPRFKGQDRFMSIDHPEGTVLPRTTVRAYEKKFFYSKMGVGVKPYKTEVSSAIE